MDGVPAATGDPVCEDKGDTVGPTVSAAFGALVVLPSGDIDGLPIGIRDEQAFFLFFFFFEEFFILSPFFFPAFFDFEILP
jgi:hypothetical protein